MHQILGHGDGAPDTDLCSVGNEGMDPMESGLIPFFPTEHQSGNCEKRP